MSPGAMLFRVGAFAALALLVVHARKAEGKRAAAVLVAYLCVMGTIRELAVAKITHAIGEEVPYHAASGLGQIGPVNVVVVAGWVFTSLLSFLLAKEIQQKNFPGTNVFLTLALTAVVTTAISYAVEVTGMRLHLWDWRKDHPVPWLPFGWPYDAFEGWAATSFMIMLVYCAVRYRLFSEVRWRSVAATIALLAVFVLADLATPWLGPESPRKKVTLVYVVLAAVLGFRAPRWLLGSSDARADAVDQTR